MKLYAKKEKLVNAESFTIDVPMYYCRIQCFTPKMNKELEDKHGWDKCADGRAENHMEESRQILVRFNVDDPGTVAHEMLHAVQFIMNHIGHTTDPDGDEPSAYLLGYLVEQYFAFKKLYKKKKK